MSVVSYSGTIVSLLGYFWHLDRISEIAIVSSNVRTHTDMAWPAGFFSRFLYNNTYENIYIYFIIRVSLISLPSFLCWSHFLFFNFPFPYPFSFPLFHFLSMFSFLSFFFLFLVPFRFQSPPPSLPLSFPMLQTFFFFLPFAFLRPMEFRCWRQITIRQNLHCLFYCYSMCSILRICVFSHRMLSLKVYLFCVSGDMCFTRTVLKPSTRLCSPFI